MSATIPDSHADLMSSKAFAHLGTLMPDGSPQVTPVWFDYDGKHVRVNSVKGRLKDKNIRHDPRVSLSMCDPENPYRYLEVRGEVVDIVEAGGVEHIDSLASKYLGVDEFPYHQSSDTRVIYLIEPRAFSSH